MKGRPLPGVRSIWPLICKGAHDRAYILERLEVVVPGAAWALVPTALRDALLRLCGPLPGGLRHLRRMRRVVVPVTRGWEGRTGFR